MNIRNNIFKMENREMMKYLIECWINISFYQRIKTITLLNKIVNEDLIS